MDQLMQETLDVVRAEAEALAFSGRLDEEALAANDRVLALDPSDVAAGNRRTRCLIALGELDLAVESLSDVLAIAPRNDLARAQLGIVAAALRGRDRARLLLSEGPEVLAAALDRAGTTGEDRDFRIEGARVLAAALA
jgi:tetratricopeptide (TPR) repeat protein